MEEKYRDICESLDWYIVSEEDGYIDLEKYSPAGEDFIMTVPAKSFVREVQEYASDFDVDDHIEMWIEARHNGVQGVPNTRTLVEDAEAIQDMLDELAEQHYRCTACGEYIEATWMANFDYHFCPNCGAQMDEGIEMT